MNFENIDEILENMKIAEKAWIDAHNLAKKIVKPGANILEVTERIENKIKETAGFGFPLNISFNNQAAHFTPVSNYKEEIKKEDVIKIDIGTEKNGYIVDAAFTIDLSKKHKTLLEASKNALYKTLDYVKKEKENSILNEIGKIAENEIQKKGFKPIYNLTGHSIDRFEIHAGMSIFNYPTNNQHKLGEGQFAIEPFATTGSGHVKSGNYCGIYFPKKGNIRNSNARKILEEALKYNGLPIAERWVGKNLNSFTKKLAINELVKNNLFIPANVLIDVKDSFVSQFEKTFIIYENKVHIFPNIDYDF